MDGYSTMGWIALALFAVLSTFSAAAQEAITPINQARLQRLEDAGATRAKAIDKLLVQSEVLASALLLLSTLANTGATAAVAVLAFYTFGVEPLAVGALAFALVTLLYFTQMLGKALSGRDPRATARLIEGPVRAVEVILSPFALVFTKIAERILGGAAFARERAAGGLNEEALYLMLGADSEEEGGNQAEQAMIHRIVEMEDKTAHEIMTPRIDIIAVDAETPASELVALAEETGFSRIPVYKGSIDDVVGVLHVKDLIPLVRHGNLTVTAGKLARQAHFIPESKHVDELLYELRHTKVHMVIVVDEYGGTAGLVTIEDLLEEIVGEIHDEYDRDEERFHVLNDREAVFAATMSIDDVNRTLGLDLQTDGFDTLGGLVYHQLGKVPETGDHFELAGLRVTVLGTEGQRIEQVKLERLDPSDDAESSGDDARPAWRHGDTAVRS
ncbi:MAG: hemolysin family protein [Chloroflexota bacterium]